MHRIFPRLLLALAAAILAVGGFIHGASFPKAQAALAGTNLPAHFIAAFKMLWLADSTSLLSVALILGYIALRPGAVAKIFVFGISLIPAATTALLLIFLGTVPAALMLTAATIATLAGGMLLAHPAPTK